MKATDGLDWSEGYRPRRALAEIVAEDQWLGNLDGAAARDRRNGARNLPSEPSDIELKVPRTRRPVSVIGSYTRRALEIDRAILAGFVLFARKVGETWSPDCARQSGDPGCGGRGSPPTRLQGLDGRGAQPQDRRRRPARCW